MPREIDGKRQADIAKTDNANTDIVQDGLHISFR
jgi:hypothetical protein